MQTLIYNINDQFYITKLIKEKLNFQLNSLQNHIYSILISLFNSFATIYPLFSISKSLYCQQIMISQKIQIKQFKTLPLRRKILSQWIFPLGDDFGKIQHEEQKNIQDYELNSLTQSVKSALDAKNDNRSSRVQTYPFLSQVSQKAEKNQNSTVSRSRNSSYGAFLNPLSSKHTTFYKKRVPSTDVPTINELNITSYRNFKIRSPLKRSKNKSTNMKEYMLERDILVLKKSPKVRIGKIISKKKSQQGKQLSTNSNVKIKWQHSYNTLEIQPKIRKQIEDGISLRGRKYSISPWENDQNINGFQ